MTPNDGTAEAAKNFTFTNTYEPSSVTIGDDTDDAITVQKTFTGRTWNDSDEFEYTLRAMAGAPEPADGTNLKIGKPTSGNSNTATFGDIEFVKEGVYEYEITETNGGLGGGHRAVRSKDRHYDEQEQEPIFVENHIPLRVCTTICAAAGKGDRRDARGRGGKQGG